MDANFEALFEAVKKNSLTEVEKILSDKSVNFDINKIADSSTKRTILHVAVSIETIDSSIVEFLLCNNAKVNENDFRNRTPLNYAVQNNRIDVVELLLKHGAEIYNCIDDYNCTPWHRCFCTGNLLLMNLILKYQPDVNFKDNRENNALHITAQYGTSEMVESVIQMGINVNDENDEGFTPLHNVLRGCNVYIDQIRKIRLLVDSGADVNAVDAYSRTPLCWATTSWDEVAVLNIVKCLLELGADPNIHGDESPLWDAASNINVEAVELLIKYGANLHFTLRGLTLVNAVAGSLAWQEGVDSVSVERILSVAKLLLIRGVTLAENDDMNADPNLFRLLKRCQRKYNNLKITRVCETCPLTYGDLLIARNESLARYLRREDFRTAIKSAIDNKNFFKYFSDDLKKKCTSGFELIKMLDDLVDLLDKVFEKVLPHNVVVLISQYFNEDDLKKCFNKSSESF